VKLTRISPWVTQHVVLASLKWAPELLRRFTLNIRNFEHLPF
jgi:hypothetical protein